MSQMAVQAGTLVQIGIIAGSAVALVALLVWLVGLALALRGSKPKERPSILRAYAICRLPVVRFYPLDVMGPGKATPPARNRGRHKRSPET